MKKREKPIRAEDKTDIMSNIGEHKSILGTSIVAISTPAGEGGIAIVRISGDNALDIALKLVKIKTKKIKKIEPRKFYFGFIETKNIKDEVLVVYFKAPNSYTREDLVEIHCHGNGLIASAIVKELILCGARAAQNGEFTKRAFLNHRIDLTQAEAVIDLINAQSFAEINSAYEMMGGGLYKKIEELQNKIVKMIAGANAAVDYPEEDVEEAQKDEIQENLKEFKKELDELISSYNESVFIKEGIKIAIAGEPNVGKSMLLNTLTQKDRAIVTDIPGTTRDTLEEQYLYKGLRFIVTDTAGLRNTEDTIEKIGIERAYNALKSADIILAVSESGDEFNQNKDILKDKKVIYVYNKIDKIKDKNSDEKIKETDEKIYISAKENININSLKEKIYKLVNGAKISGGGARLNNVRHYDAALKAMQCLLNAENNLDNFTLDCIISDLHHAYRALGSITGAVSSEEIVEEIFSRFCVGK